MAFFGYEDIIDEVTTLTQFLFRSSKDALMKSYMRILFLLLVSASFAIASKEGLIQVSELTYSSKGIGNSGPVNVCIKTDDDGGVNKFVIKTFGKTVDLPKSDLERIPKFLYNGINVSYERGYPEVGGKTLYIVLSSRLSESVMNETMIVVTETLPIEIFEKKAKREVNIQDIQP